MIRGIFWIVLPLGVLLCAMAIVSLAVNGLDVDLAGTPQRIYGVYRAYLDRFFAWGFEQGLGWNFPGWFKDIVLIWTVFFVTLASWFVINHGTGYDGRIETIIAYFILGLFVFVIGPFIYVGFIVPDKRGDIYFSNTVYMHLFVLAIIVFCAMFFLWNYTAIT